MELDCTKEINLENTRINLPLKLQSQDLYLILGIHFMITFTKLPSIVTKFPYQQVITNPLHDWLHKSTFNNN